MRAGQSQILVVDDEQSVRRNLEKTLTKEGHFVVTANNGDEAIRELELQSFDLIILDIIMPDWTGKLSKRAGIDILRQIRSKESNIPVILLSANENIELVSEATIQGPTKYLVKGSVTEHDFKKIVQNALIEMSQPQKDIDKLPKMSKSWLLDRFVSILDEVVTGVIVTIILYILGKVTGNLKGNPLEWLSNATSYVIISIMVIILTLGFYIIWRRKSK